MSEPTMSEMRTVTTIPYDPTEPVPEPVLVLTPGPDGSVDVIRQLHVAMTHLPGVGKDSRHQGGNATGNWSYRSADATVDAVHAALRQAELVIVGSNETEPKMVEIGRKGNGELILARQVAMRYTLFAFDGSSLSGVFYGHGVGATAYALGSALSYAIKYALSQIFLIPFDEPKMDGESNEGGQAQADNQAEAGWWEQAGWESEDEHAQARTDLRTSIGQLPESTREVVLNKLAQLPTGMADHKVILANRQLAARLTKSAASAAAKVVLDELNAEPDDDDEPFPTEHDQTGEPMPEMGRGPDEGELWQQGDWGSADEMADAVKGFRSGLKEMATDNPVAFGLAKAALMEEPSVLGFDALWVPEDEAKPAGPGRPASAITKDEWATINRVFRTAVHEANVATKQAGNGDKPPASPRSRKPRNMKALEDMLSGLSVRRHDAALAELDEADLVPISDLDAKGVATAMGIVTKYAAEQAKADQPPPADQPPVPEGEEAFHRPAGEWWPGHWGAYPTPGRP